MLRAVYVENNRVTPKRNAVMGEDNIQLVEMSEEDYNAPFSKNSDGYIIEEDGTARLKTEEERGIEKELEDKEDIRINAKEAQNASMENLTINQDGHIIQCRAIDLSIMEGKLKMMGIKSQTTVNWTLKNNTVKMITKEQLQQAYEKGLEEFEQIVVTYQTVLIGLEG